MNTEGSPRIYGVWERICEFTPGVNSGQCAFILMKVMRITSPRWFDRRDARADPPKIRRDRSDFHFGANADRDVPRIVGVPEGQAGVLITKNPASLHLRLDNDGLEGAGRTFQSLATGDVGDQGVDLPVGEKRETGFA